MSNEYAVDSIVVPPIGFKAKTQADCLAEMGVKDPRRALPGNSTWQLHDAAGNKKEVAFFNEGSKRVDAVSTLPSDGDYLLEQWEGERDGLGCSRYTFVNREDGSGYEFMGETAIVALFGEKPDQITLWRRVK
ncbi:hypothetical protein [Bifidobacterium tibiigranuli]|uniref:hypothetical protein n=1 Tax=Bifidobacterium tibiigranuli TaxID=2172043 RepID=UPI0023561032|nr:hypothetical protein [Bifidobacterium tibiigranuli]MCI1210994.1 hypothetical protein [Bifidobacterium tibiigranuli]MCI1220438.1 hypothetical protein [Bifidobacterium tibiigranuli]